MALYKSSELTDRTVKLISDFQSGKVTPIDTGIDHLNKACFGGLTPSLIVGITARSFQGKTFDLEKIQSHIKENEPDVIMINGNYELNFFKILLRDIAQKTGKTQAEILYDNPTKEDLIKLKEIVQPHRNDNIYYQNEPVSSIQFFEDVKFIIDSFPDKKIVVTIDNLENILDDKGSQKSSIDSFLTQINRLKDMHWFICFIILNQLNDNILQRLDNPKQHKPKESDIYSSGQYYKLCDVLYVKVLPWRMHLTDKFMVFAKEAYEWLEDFKIYGSGNTASFDPIGSAYYFYLKRRGTDIKDMQDVYAERIFKKDETVGKIPSTTPTFSSYIPSFNTVDFTVEKPSVVAPNFDLASAFDTPDNKKSEDPF
jgi:hypothetical protein|nr:MAG TPA: Helicase, ATPase, REPLICATION [Caudoviricetes sp.]